MTQDVNVVLIDFHHSGNEMVVENEDGSFTILINSRLSNSGQIAAYNHAMKHINDDDFQKECVQTIEFSAHDISIPKDAEHIPADKYIRQIRAIQRRRRKIQKQLKQLEEDLKDLDFSSDEVFDRAERIWLYGNDL